MDFLRIALLAVENLQTHDLVRQHARGSRGELGTMTLELEVAPDSREKESGGLAKSIKPGQVETAVIEDPEHSGLEHQLVERI